MCGARTQDHSMMHTMNWWGLLLAVLCIALCINPTAGEEFHEFICKEHNRFRLNPAAALKLVDVARKAVGLSAISRLDGETPREHIKYVESIFEVSHGVSLYNISGVPVAYARIYKAGNNDIRENLDHIHYQKINMEGQSFMYGNVATNEASVKYWVEKIWNRSEVPAFTFAREPLEHFASGFREYLYRCPDDIPTGTTVITKDFVRSAVLRVLTNTVSPCGQAGLTMTHIYPMSGVLRPYLNLHFVGRLENFDADWKAVELMYNVKLPFNHSLGAHQSSVDAHGVTAAVKDLFATEPEFLLAVCALLYYDFHCFEYALPSGCEVLRRQEWMKSYGSHVS